MSIQAVAKGLRLIAYTFIDSFVNGFISGYLNVFITKRNQFEYQFYGINTGKCESETISGMLISHRYFFENGVKWDQIWLSFNKRGVFDLLQYTLGMSKSRFPNLEEQKKVQVHTLGGCLDEEFLRVGLKHLKENDYINIDYREDGIFIIPTEKFILIYENSMTENIDFN